MMSESSPPEVRCPMCSKPNPADAEVCEFCGARIKPLVIQPGEEAPVLGIRSDETHPPTEEAPHEPVEQQIVPDEQSGESTSPPETDWLSRMRGGMEAEEDRSSDTTETEDSGETRGKTDLLGRLRGLGLAEEEKEPSLESETGEFEQRPMEDEAPEPAEAADWLSRIRDKQDEEGSFTEEEPDISLGAQPPSRVDEYLSEIGAADQGMEAAPASVDDEIDSLMDQLDEKLSSIAPVDETQAPEVEADLPSMGSEAPETAAPETGAPTDDSDVSIADLIDEFESERPIDEHELEFVEDKISPLEEHVDDEALEELFAEIESSEDLIDSGEGSPLADIFEDEEETESALENLFESIGASDVHTSPEPESLSLSPEEEDDFARIDQLFDSIEGDADAEATGEDPLDIIGDQQTEDTDLELEELFGGSGVGPEQDLSRIEDADLLAALQEAEEEEHSGLDDLFADFEGPIGTSELLSATHDTPSETSENLESSTKLEQLFAEIESGGPSRGKDIPSMDMDGESTAEPLIDSDFLADLGIEVPEEGEGSIPLELEPDDEPETPFGESEPLAMEETEPSFSPSDFLAPGSDSLAAAPDEPEFEDETETLQLDTTSAPPFSLGEVDSEEVDKRLDEFQPSWLREGQTSQDPDLDEEGELPHVPALLVDDDSEFGEEDILSGSVVEGDMPSWLQDLGADIEEEDLEGQGEEPAIELARAKLPAWLEAMRPIETFNMESVESDTVEDEFVEAAGPLAGLKGVLLAEPVVAMPRTASAGVVALDITENHYANTEILRKMVAEEELELAQPIEISRPYPLLRWAISAIVVLAVALPMILGIPTFNEPRFAPRGLNAMLETVNASPANRPALMIFDYEPGYSAEMDTTAGALVENLLSRDQSIVTLSTRLTGPLLADRMILRIGSEYEITNGIDYVHLGYLSGGPSAIQLFASSPRDSLTSGFRPPEDENLSEVWETPPLINVQDIADFSSITVITSATELARTWIEQLSPAMGDSPLILVVTAGAEPIVRPYFESRTPQIQGILTGLQAGVKYEVWNGKLGDASQRWNSFGAGMIVAELVLIAALVYGSVTWFLRQRRLLPN